MKPDPQPMRADLLCLEDSRNLRATQPPVGFLLQGALQTVQGPDLSKRHGRKTFGPTAGQLDDLAPHRHWNDRWPPTARAIRQRRGRRVLSESSPPPADRSLVTPQLASNGRVADPLRRQENDPSAQNRPMWQRCRTGLCFQFTTDRRSDEDTSGPGASRATWNWAECSNRSSLRVISRCSTYTRDRSSAQALITRTGLRGRCTRLEFWGSAL